VLVKYNNSVAGEKWPVTPPALYVSYSPGAPRRSLDIFNHIGYSAFECASDCTTSNSNVYCVIL
jgi:hypothetical protein